MRVEGWIYEGNLPAFVELVASFLGYAWDDGDQATMDHGITGSRDHGITGSPTPT